MQQKFLTSLITSPWAIRPDFLGVIADTLARLVRGEPMSLEDRARIDARRGELASAHPDPGALAWDDDDPMPPRARARGGAAYAGTIAVVQVYGVLSQRGGIDVDTSEPLTSMTSVANSVRLLAADAQISAIVLDVDSPGGTVYGIQELGDAIYGAREAKPVVAVANSLAASAAYWMASQAGELYAAPGAEVGSIGVYTLHNDVSRALEQAGVSTTLIAAGKYKTEASPFAPLSDSARAYVQSMIDEYYDAFTRAVARGRGTTIKAVREDMGQGRTLLPPAAKAARMIDGTATLNEVIADLRSRGERGRSARSLAPRLGARERQEFVDREAESLQALEERMQSLPAAPARAKTRRDMQRELEEILERDR